MAVGDVDEHPTKYNCLSCSSVAVIRPTQHLLCPSCGHRVLTKTRTDNMVQYEAR